MNRDTRSRKWQLTLNNPEEHGFDREMIKAKLEKFKSVEYWCMADEIGDEGTPHTHIYMAGSEAIRFSTIKKKFEKAHIEMARGTSQQNRDYIFKEGKWEKEKKSHTHLAETREEFGQMPLERQGARNDLNDLYDQLKSDMAIDEIIEDSPQHMMKIDKMEKIKQMILEKRYRKTFRELYVTYVHGETGKGKTRDIMEKYDYDVYRVTSYDNPFDRYNGEDVIIFDEFRNSLKLKEMPVYLEGYPLRLPARYTDKQACYTKVYIVSNRPLNKQYPEIQKNDKESRNAFERRIHKIKEYRGDKVIEVEITDEDRKLHDELEKIATDVKD